MEKLAEKLANREEIKDHLRMTSAQYTLEERLSDLLCGFKQRVLEEQESFSERSSQQEFPEFKNRKKGSLIREN